MEVASLRRGESAAAARRGRLASAGAALARSRELQVLVGLTLLAAALRFATLGDQSYHHDEVVTASRVLRGSFGHAIDKVDVGESTPPLYYVLAWVWTQAAGTGEWGLRSFSALAGVATVPAAFLLGRELRDARAGLWTAALAAVNPMLLWYSQEARAYSLLVLLGTISLWLALRAVRSGSRRDLLWWGVVSALALATHYFAAFPLAAEAVLVWRARGRASLAGLAVLAVAAAALAPLALHQAGSGNADWIAEYGLGHRLWETAAAFVTGETAAVIGRPERPWLAFAPLALVLAALALLALRRMAPERRAAAPALFVVAAAVGVPALMAVAATSLDYILARNLIAALVPLLAAVAIAISAPAARRLGPVIGAALLVYGLGFCVLASADPTLQRPDWRAAAAKIGEPSGPRALVLWSAGEAPLRYYLSTGSFQVHSVEGFRWLVGEVELISSGRVPAPPARLLGPNFVLAGVEDAGQLQIHRYRARGGRLAHLPLRLLPRADLRWRTNGVLLDGIGP